MKKARKILLASVFAVSAFFAGIAIACDGNYGTPWNTMDCVTLDEFVQTPSCNNLDSTGWRCWNCTQEVFYCFDDQWELAEAFGPAFNCHTPGPTCQ